MVRKIKNVLYFTVASYFRLFATIRLARWKPRVVVVTGSNGKTTALHLIETQLGKNARYSHGANSSFGIPFDILGLSRDTYSPLEWLALGLLAPFCAWKKSPPEKIYVVEADCDRPGEGRFLSTLLNPEVVVWLSSARTHSMNFDKRVRAPLETPFLTGRAGEFRSVDEAIAHEFGYFAKHASKLVIVNADNPLITTQLTRTTAVAYAIRGTALGQYDIGGDGTGFTIGGRSYRVPYLLPKETFYAIAAAVKLADYFGKAPHSDLSSFVMPPGRSSILKGIRNTTIIDSSYNANASSVEVFLRMIERMHGKKWLVLGDLTEQGAHEKEEHEKVARLAAHINFEKIVLVGPRLKKYALPLLNNAKQFDSPKNALDHLNETIKGGETLAFKGARFLEGIVERLLADKADADKLCRRELVWQKRRAKWGL